MKKTNLLLTLLVLISYTITQAQVWEGDYLINDDDDLVAFPTLCNCNEITGDLSIINNIFSESLQSLFNLDSLFVVGGNLTINCQDIESISSLSSLTYVGGDLTIDYGELLNFEGLESLSYIGGNLYLRHHQDATSLEGFGPSLVIGGNVYISDNEFLENIDALINVIEIQGDSLIIEDNESLNDCCILNCLVNNGVVANVQLDNNSQNCNSLTNLQLTCNDACIIDCFGFIGGPNYVGTPCDDGNPNTEEDVYQKGCICQGQAVDCEGVLSGSALPFTPCDDGDPYTINDTYGEFCYCTGEVLGYYVSGYILDTDGNPITSGNVYIVDSEGNFLAVVSPDENGAYSIFVPSNFDGYLGADILNYSFDSTDFSNSPINEDISLDLTANGGVNIEMTPYLTGFSLSPIPAKNSVQLSFTSEKSKYLAYEVYSLSGEMILQAPLQTMAGTNTLNIAIEDWPVGVYLIRIVDGENAVTRRIVKQ